MEYDIVLQSIKNNFHLIQLKIFTNLVFKLNFFFFFQFSHSLRSFLTIPPSLLLLLYIIVNNDNEPR